MAGIPDPSFLVPLEEVEKGEPRKAPSHTHVFWSVHSNELIRSRTS